MQIHYKHQCIDANLNEGIVKLKNLNNGEVFEDQADLVFAADGAFSAVRYNAMQKVDRFNYSQFYIEDGYKELLLPADENGNYQLEKNALHIWPRVDLCLLPFLMKTDLLHAPCLCLMTTMNMLLMI